MNKVQKDAIVKISDEILNELLRLKEKDKSLTFSLRQRNSVGSGEKRLEIGHWFQGSNYIYVPLFKIGDSSRRIKTIGLELSIDENGKPTEHFLVVSFKSGPFNDSDYKFYNELIGHFEMSTNDDNYASKYYPNPENYIDNLRDYVSNKRPVIFQLLEKYNLLDKYVITEQEFQKYLRKINAIKAKLSMYQNVEVLKLIESYKLRLKNEGLENEIYKWNLINEFEGRPKLNEATFAEDIKTINYSNLIYPSGLGVIRHLANDRPQEYLDCFKILFDENIELDERINNFHDETRKLYKDLVKDYSHHHDERTMATFLTFYNPEKYALYKDSFYQKYCELIDVEPKEARYKYVHYLDLLKEFIQNYVKQDNELLKLYRSLLPNSNTFQDNNYLLLAQDMLYRELEFPYGGEISKTVDDDKNLKMNIDPTNLILFGPPGTGKTYSSINHALSIIEKNSIDLQDVEDYNNEDRSEILERYRSYLEEKQIVFTTFHQSMSYEDFVEGIKPLKSDEKDSFLKYDIVPGIFKQICNRARRIYFEKVNIDWDNVMYFKMSLGGIDRSDIHEWCIDNNYVALGKGGEDDLKKYTRLIGKWDEFRDAYTKDHIKEVEESRFNTQAAHIFLKMKVDDVVVISKGNFIIDAIGIIKGEYEWHDDFPTDYYHYRKVQWLATNMEVSPDRFLKKNITQMSIYNIDKQYVKIEELRDYTDQNVNEMPEKPHVLIIDEINRGNISQILGELITLIEPDKRQGMPEALELTLPYSKEKFSVPSNLHIIGTMNTADRSVEALDTALRRRFEFKEMVPRPELVSPARMIWNLFWKYEEVKWENAEYKNKEAALLELLKPQDFHNKKKIIWDKWDDIQLEKQIVDLEQLIYSGINLQTLLIIINDRIEKLLDKDHKIGHSYFMSVYSLEDLKAVFRNCVIPLLEEYFFGDYGKIGLVLGSSFVEKEAEASFSFAKFNDYDQSIQNDLKDRVIYKIRDEQHWNFSDI
jgi:5-methylcytosine-specific restriction endonuclease McrBC GTP-binding regulatory subunit McrB